MKPIKALLKQKFNIIDEKDLDIDYENSTTYHFMPEFLEKAYTGENAEHLKSANTMLIEYANKRDTLKYIGQYVWDKPRMDKQVIEYYLDENDDYVIMLISVPRSKKYYPSLQQVIIAKRKGNIQ